MAIILATVTEDARKYWPQFFGGLLGISDNGTVNDPPGPPTWDPRLLSFKVGEGGWVDPGGGPVPRAPDPTLRVLVAPPNDVQDLDAIVDPTRPLISQRYNTLPTPTTATFEKAFVPADLTYPATNTIQARCFLDFGDFNDDGFGNSPEIWEIAIFSDHPAFARVAIGTPGAKRLMVAYGTVPKEIKDATKQIQHFVRVVF